MDQNYMTQIASYLENGCHFDPQTRRNATECITQAEQTLAQYGLILIQIAASNSFPENTRHIAAITLKNYVTKHYKYHDDIRNKVPNENKNEIKSKIIDLLIVSSDGIKKQLMETVNAICAIDYPENWPGLLSYIVSKLNSVPISSMKDLFSVTDLIFKRYCYEIRSDDLWAEIKFSLKEFALPLTTIFTRFYQQLPNLTDSDPNTAQIYSTLILSVKMFYSLNYQDLPEFFEDNMATWMNGFGSVLSLPVISAPMNVRPLLSKLQKQICDCIQLYTARYLDEFTSYTEPFAQSVCKLLFPLPSEQQYDSLASSALNFLCSFSQDEHNKFFANPGVMESMCRDIIILSIQLNDADWNLFFEEPFEYIERDLEDSLLKTRRKTAMELLTYLCIMNEHRVINIFSGFIDQLLEKYNSNRRENWKLMDAAMLLVTALASRKQNTANTTPLIDPKAFFVSRLQNELNISDVDLNIREYAFIKSDLLRYLISFKNMFNDEEKCSILEKAVLFLRSPIVVVHTYASILIDCYFSIKEFVSTFQRLENNIVHFLSIYYPAILNILSSSQLDDNIYAMKSLMKVVEATKTYTFRHLDIIRVYFRDKLPVIISNPSKSSFIHYFFEVFCKILIAECACNSAALNYYNSFCLQNFEKVFSGDISDLQPYAIQIMAVLIEQHPKGNLSDVYRNFLPFLFKGSLVDSTDLISPFFRIIKAYLCIDPVFLLSSVTMETLFEVAYKPIKMCGFERYGFSLISSLLIACPNECLLLFEKLFKSLIDRFLQTKILTYKRVFRQFIFNLIVIFGTSFVMALLQKSMQQQPVDFIAKYLYTRFITFTDDVEKKIYFVGISRLLFDTLELYNNSKYMNFWSSFFVNTVNLIQPDPNVSKKEQFILNRVEHATLQDDNLKFTMSILASAGSSNIDPISDVDYKELFVQYLKKFVAHSPTIMNSLIEMCPLAKREHVVGYIRSVGAF